MLGWQSRECGHAHGFRAPPSRSEEEVKRTLTVTLAWSSPINPRHKDYLRAFLRSSSDKEVLALEKKDHDFASARRGTALPQVFEGDKAFETFANSAMRGAGHCDCFD
jgi:hypothetical protein